MPGGHESVFRLTCMGKCHIDIAPFTQLEGFARADSNGRN